MDPGGNWLRISRLGDADADSPDQPDSADRLARVLAAAARQADSHGDEAAGLRVLENGLARHADAPPVQRLPVLVYLAELRLRTGGREAAAARLAEFSQALRPYVDGAYVNVPNIGMAEWETAYWGSNFDRLRKIKAKYDPHNVFQYEQSIPPAAR
ncbi:BBE domain-containing protein [Plantactinospora sp. CA-290183]|uniref:BBE domain-containing protein n=1 Tax=Plantactinospora sp. CA-290183 TaxID=3240006 RepID=UPI003D93F228